MGDDDPIGERLSLLRKRKERSRSEGMAKMDEKKRCTTETEISDEIIHPSHTSKQYKSITLENGLSVLLVSDKETSQSAAAMTVRVGSFLDPPEIPGLSHLLEHMVFTGSHQFPGDNELKDFLSKHGGDANASTEMEHSTFYMGVENTYLGGALQRFAELFIQPLMKIEYIEKEITLIDSEFELCKQSDDCRLGQLMAHTSTKGHPFNRFTWGNKISLSTDELSMGSLQNHLLELFNECFVASSMKLVVVSDASFQELETLVTQFFSSIKKGSQIFPKSNPNRKIWDSNYLYNLESVG